MAGAGRGPTPAARGYNPRMSRNTGYLLAAGLLAIAALTGWGLISAVRDASRQAAAPAAGAATQVEQLIHPTPTIYPDSITVIRQIQALARLETAQYTLEKVIRAEVGQGAFGALFGDRLLFVAHGQVTAGVDLSRMQPGDVVVAAEAGRVTLVLPAAEIFSVAVQNDQSYVYDRQTGLLTRGDVNLETLARRAAEDEIRQGALEGGILTQAQTNAGSFLQRFLAALRFRDVILVAGTPQP